MKKRKDWNCLRCGRKNHAKTGNLYFSCWKCGHPKDMLYDPESECFPLDHLDSRSEKYQEIVGREEPDPYAHLVDEPCATCGDYAPVGDMVTQDKALICKPCWRAQRPAKPTQPRASEAAQERLFQ